MPILRRMPQSVSHSCIRLHGIMTNIPPRSEQALNGAPLSSFRVSVVCLYYSCVSIYIIHRVIAYDGRKTSLEGSIVSFESAW